MTFGLFTRSSVCFADSMPDVHAAVHSTSLAFGSIRQTHARSSIDSASPFSMAHNRTAPNRRAARGQMAGDSRAKLLAAQLGVQLNER
jgi:hypothetical protein